MTFPTLLRRTVVPTILLTGCALFLIGCAGRKKPKSPTHADARIATPPHNLPPEEYPFDDDGRYRKDWVANPSAAKRTATPRRSPQQTVTESAPPPPYISPPPAPSPAPPARQAPPAPRPQPTTPKPAPAAAKPARYHTVVKGDTLYSISRKFGVTVPQLKSTNGLTSDTIRLGQTLRIP